MRVTKRPLGQLILDVLQSSPTQHPAAAYDDLYELVRPLRGGNPSRRDFQKALDTLRNDGQIIIQEDPKDRRRKLIRQARTEKAHHGEDYGETLAGKMKGFLVDLFNREPWLMPVKLWLSQIPPGASPRELINFYPWWYGLTENQAREVTSMGMTVWRKALTKTDDKFAAQEAKELELIKTMAEVNAEELANAWRQRRTVDRSKIISDLEKRLLAKARGEVTPEYQTEELILTPQEEAHFTGILLKARLVTRDEKTGMLEVTARGDEFLKDWEKSRPKVLPAWLRNEQEAQLVVSKLSQLSAIQTHNG